jgi:hypothetical protein
MAIKFVGRPATGLGQFYACFVVATHVLALLLGAAIAFIFFRGAKHEPKTPPKVSKAKLAPKRTPDDPRETSLEYH